MAISKYYPAVPRFFGAAFSAAARFCALALLSLMISGTAASAQSVTITPAGTGPANVRTFDAGGSLTLNAVSISGLTAPFEYRWQTPNAAGTPAGITFSATNGPTLTITASPSVLDSTTFSIRLEVSGSTSAGPAINSASITVRNHNEEPTANAGDNQRVGKGAFVTLDGTGSDDPDGGNSDLSYFWEQTAGPDVTLSSSTAAQPTFTIPNLIPLPPSPASVTFNLRVRDVAWPATDEDNDEVRILIRPLFRTTIDDLNYDAGNVIDDLILPTALTATGVTNAYTLGSEPSGLSFNASNRTLSGTPTETMRTRTFNLTYTATNGDGDTDSLPFSITVTNAEATGAPTISGDPTENQVLTATANTNIINDANRFEVISEGVPPEFTYQWQADGADISGATSSTYTLTTAEIGKAITVTASFIDGGGRQESRTSAATAAVRAANEPPMASAGSNQTVDEGATVILDGSGTTDPDIATGDTLTYSWAQTSGTTVTLNDTSAISPTFTAPVRQTMTDGGLAFTLTVTDSENETSTATVTISVTNLPPTAGATVVGGTVVNEGEEVTLDGSGSSGLPGDGRTYAWTQTSGTDVTLNDATAISPTFTAPVRLTADDEELVFSLTVRDAAGGSNTVTVTISVTNLPPEAKAGEPQTVDEGEEVTLDGSGSSGLPGDGRTYAWAQTGGTPVTLTGADTVTATFIAPVRRTADDGEFEFTLTVRDAAGAENTDTVAISVSTDASVQKTVETINRFMETRTRLILANQPDASRRIDRLRSGVGPEQLSFATGEINKLMPVDFNLRDLGSGNYDFATSLDQVTRAAAHLQVAQEGGGSHERRRFDVWVEGSFHEYNGAAGSEGDFGIAHLGIDYLFSPDLLVGAVLQYDRLSDNSDGEDTRTEGTGWMAGPYVTARLQENLYLDVHVAEGKSDNDVTATGSYTDNFKSTRWLADVSLSGVFTHDQWTLRPNAALSWLEDEQEAYTSTLGDTVPSQTISQRQFRFGPTISRRFLSDNGWHYEPTFTLDAIYNHANARGVTLTTAGQEENGWRARVKPGISMTSPDGARLSLTGTYDGIGQSDFEAWGLGLNLDVKF